MQEYNNPDGSQATRCLWKDPEEMTEGQAIWWRDQLRHSILWLEQSMQRSAELGNLEDVNFRKQDRDDCDEKLMEIRLRLMSLQAED